MRRCALLATAAAALAFPASAAAHVQITQVAVGEGALFTVTSPNENQSQDLTGLRLTVPDGLTVSEIADAPGFAAQIVRDQSGRAVALSWQGGKVAPEHLAVFQFAGADSGGATALTAVQTFADGSTKLWKPELSAASGTSSGSDDLARAVAGAALVVALAAAGAALAGRRKGRAG
jgi:hypothetical protein